MKPVNDPRNYPDAWKPKSKDEWKGAAKIAHIGPKPPAEPKPDIDCCDPIWIPAPSGWHWFHSKTCRVDPRQKVDLRKASVAAHPAKGNFRPEPIGDWDWAYEIDDDGGLDARPALAQPFDERERA